jgi:hypothetical protein
MVPNRGEAELAIDVEVRLSQQNRDAAPNKTLSFLRPPNL